MAVTRDQMLAVLNAQRAAFTAELPVSAAVRKDRLKRAIALLVDHGDAFCKAMSEDFGHRSHEQSMMTDITTSIRVLKATIKQVDQWMKPEKRKAEFPLGLLGAKAAVEFQPVSYTHLTLPTILRV